MTEDSKTLDVSGMQDLQEKVSDVKGIGDPGIWRLLCKASSEKEGWMKSTKVMLLAGEQGGALIQVTTQQRNRDGTYALAEALVFVPGADEYSFNFPK